MIYDFDFSFIGPFVPAFFNGALVTLEISILSFILGTAVGVLFGLMFVALRRPEPALLVNDAVRALPPLVLIFFFYFFPYNNVFGIQPLSAIFCAILGLAVSQAAYTADIFYSAYKNVSPRLTEGADALGLSKFDKWKYIIFPDIVRQNLPVQSAFFVGILRLSSLGAVIGAQDVVYVARISIAQSFRSLEAWIVVGLVYIALVTPFTILTRYLEASSWVRRRH